MLDGDRSYSLRPSTNLSSSISQEKFKTMGPKKPKASSGNQSTVRDENVPQRSPSGSPSGSPQQSVTPKRGNAKQAGHVTAQPADGSASPGSVHTKPGTKPSSGQFDVLIGNEIKDMIYNLSKEMTTRFDNMKLEMHMMRVELTETRKIIQDLEHSVSYNSNKIQEIEKDVLPKMMNDLNEKNKQLEEKLLLLELHDRKQNLLMYGVQEVKNENVYNTVQGVIAHFLEIPHIDASKIPLVNAHRLPAPHHSSSDKGATLPAPRPIIIRFALMEDRNRLLDSFENSNRQHPPQNTRPLNQQTTTNQHASDPQSPMQASPPLSQPSQKPHQAPRQPIANDYDRVSIRTDLPPSMKRERGRLASIAFKLRKENNLSTRIRQNGTTLYLQTRKKVANGSPKSPWSNWEE